LPTASARHLYVTIACLDPVLDEESMSARLQADGLDDPLGDGIGLIRARHPMSLRDLAVHSGMSGSTVEQALAILQTPLFWHSDRRGKPDLPLIGSLEADRAGMRCYFPERKAVARWWWTPDYLNSRGEVKRTRDSHWPEIAAERQRREDQRRNKRAEAQRRELEERKREARERRKALQVAS
jgi:hypothetical protein